MRALDPRLQGTLEALGRLYNSKGDFEKSITAYNGAIETGASGAGIHASLANSLELKGDLRSALGSYRDALRIEKANAEALSGVARLRAALNPPAPKPDPVQIADRARDLLHQGNTEQAKSTFIKATKLDRWPSIFTLLNLPLSMSALKPSLLKNNGIIIKQK